MTPTLNCQLSVGGGNDFMAQVVSLWDERNKKQVEDKNQLGLVIKELWKSCSLSVNLSHLRQKWHRFVLMKNCSASIIRSFVSVPVTLRGSHWEECWGKWRACQGELLSCFSAERGPTPIPLMNQEYPGHHGGDCAALWGQGDCASFCYQLTVV